MLGAATPPTVHTVLACALCSNFLKSYEYVNRVKRFKDKEAVQQVRQCARPADPAALRPAECASAGQGSGEEGAPRI